jgi:hypothetical protein
MLIPLSALDYPNLSPLFRASHLAPMWPSLAVATLVGFQPFFEYAVYSGAFP